MIGTLTITKKGQVEEISETLSTFTPSDDVKKITSAVQRDYEIGDHIQKDPMPEFNEMSFLDRLDTDKKAFNNYTPPKSQDPTVKWRHNGIWPMTRDKLLTIAAHIIALIMVPTHVAQNDQDEEDKKMSYVMDEMVEYNVRDSDYEKVYMYAVAAGLYSPVVYIEVDYSEVKQTIRVVGDDGNIEIREELDEEFSGLQISNVPADEIYISNHKQYKIQKQRFIIRKRLREYADLEAIYGDHPNWKHVNMGITALYDKGTDLFYNFQNDELLTLGEEVIYKNRREDIEIPFVNGVYMGNASVGNNPMKHRDHKNRPKYNIAKFGYHPVDEGNFFFYKSGADELGPNQDLVTRMFRILADGAWLDAMPPVTVSGGHIVGTELNMPGAVTTLPGSAEVKPILAGRNFMAISNVMDMINSKAEEQTVSKGMQGGLSDQDRTLGEVERAEMNARTQFGWYGNMIGTMVKDVGELVTDIVVHKQTIPMVGELLGGNAKLTYPSYLIPNKTEGGKKVTKKIEFDASLIGEKMNEKESMKASYGVLKRQGGLDSDKKIIRVNPEKFHRMKFLTIVEVDTLMPKNETAERELKLKYYQEMIQNEFTDKVNVTRDFLVEPIAKSDTDKYLMKKEDIMSSIEQAQQQGADPGQAPAPGQPKPAQRSLTPAKT